MSNTPLSMHAITEIKSWIGKRDLNKSELARRLGVSHTWVSNRLAGHQEITLNELQRIADALDVQVADLLPRRDPQGETGQTGRRSDRIAYRSPAGRPSHLLTICTNNTSQPAEPVSNIPVTSRTRTDRPAVRSWRHGGVAA